MRNPHHNGKPIDVLQARTAQGRAIASMLLASYSAQPAATMDHPLQPRDMCETLWALVTLLDQACDASDQHTEGEAN